MALGGDLLPTYLGCMGTTSTWTPIPGGLCGPMGVELHLPPGFSHPLMSLCICWHPWQKRCLEAGKEEVGLHSGLLTDSCVGLELPAGP